MRIRISKLVLVPIRILRLAVVACLAVVFLSSANAMVIPAFFGWNYVFLAPVAPNPQPPVQELMSITYDGGAGLGLVMPIPAFGGPYLSGGPYPFGMPDFAPPLGGLGPAPPTFTALGDGESTRTIGVLLGIDWNPAGAAVPYSLAPLPFPSIGITGFTTDHDSYAGFPLTAAGTPHYIVGLIPPTATELCSPLLAPQGDIYGPLPICALGNPTLTATGAGIGPLVPGDFITVVFGAAAVPVPAAVWLFGSALGLLGWIKRKRTT